MFSAQANNTDVVGNQLVFNNTIYDGARRNVVGADAGSCVRVIPGVAWACTWSTTLHHFNKSAIMVQGTFFDAAPSELAVTGGTGKFSGAGGTLSVSTISAGFYHFIFRLFL